ncbi:MAG: apolipoprotein N-acyltransferase [Planctomycetota bacterium]
MNEEADTRGDESAAASARPGGAWRGKLLRALRARVSSRLDLHTWELLVAAASGALLSLCYVRPFVSELALIAPAGLLFVVARARPAGAAVLAALFAITFAGPGLAWAGAVTWFGWAGLVFLFALSFAALGGLVSFEVGRLRLPVAVVAPPVWVALEFVRAHVFTGFPWLMLGHAFSDRLVFIQIADLGGAYAVSFVAALWCSALVDLLRQSETKGFGRGLRGWGRGWKSVAAAGGVLAATLSYGAWRLATLRTRPGPRLVLVQGNIYTPRAVEGDKERKEVNEEIWKTVDELSRGAFAAEPEAEGSVGRAELLVWSESMLYGYFNDADDADAPVWTGRLRGLLGELGVPLLAGSNATGLHPDVRRHGPPPTGCTDYNSVFLVSPDGTIAGRYDKIHLVPFGEYIPFIRWPVLSKLTPYAANDPGYAHGEEGQPLIRWNGRAFGVLICYEAVFAGLARRSALMGADFLVNLSSEAWFAGTSEIPQHFRISRFRAVENRLPLVRCCNVGVTCFIDPAGRTVAMLAGSDTPRGAKGTLSGTVPLAETSGRTLYAAAGDVFAWLSTAAAAALAGFALVLGRGRPGTENRAKSA